MKTTHFKSQSPTNVNNQSCRVDTLQGIKNVTHIDVNHNTVSQNAADILSSIFLHSVYLEELYFIYNSIQSVYYENLE